MSSWPKAPLREGRLRIGLVHTSLPQAGRKLGGVEVAVHRLANALVDLGQDRVTVLSPDDCPPTARYEYRPLFQRMRPYMRGRFGRLVAFPALLNLVDFRALDVVHLHGDDWFFIRRRVASVRTLNGSSLREAQHASSFLRKSLCYLVWPLEHVSVRLSTGAVALGRDTGRIYGISRIIAYGVERETFHPGAKSPRPRVLFVGTWKGRKRGQFVYEVFVREILPRVPDAELCMVSDFCPAHPSVIAEQFPSDEVLAARYREAWVCAFASTYEGFGLPYVEALASGTAVVATPNPGAEEVLDEGRCGLLTSDDGFAGCVVELLGNERLRAEMERRGRERAEEFAWRNIARLYREAYVAAIEARSARRQG